MRPAQIWASRPVKTSRFRTRLRSEALEDRSLLAVAAFSVNLDQDLGGTEIARIDPPPIDEPAPHDPDFTQIDFPPMIDPVQAQAGLQVNLYHDAGGVLLGDRHGKFVMRHRRALSSRSSRRSA